LSALAELLVFIGFGLEVVVLVITVRQKNESVSHLLSLCPQRAEALSDAVV